MRNRNKTKAQLMNELAEARQRIAELEASDAERKRAEEALRDFLDNASDLIQSVAPDGHFLYVNRRWRETLGYAEEEIAGLSLFDIIHPESLAHCHEVFQRVIAGENVDRVEAKFVTKDGRTIVVEGSANCRLEGGKPVATRGLFRDITDRKRAEEALRESEERLKTLVENAPEAIFLVDAGGKFLDGNRKAEELIGCSRGEFIGRNFAEVVVLDNKYVAKARARLKASSQGQTTGPGEYELVRKDGSRAVVEVNAIPVEREGKVEIIGIVRDITDRKQMEAAVKSERDKLQSLMSGLAYAQLGIDMVGMDYKILFQNETLTERFGDLTGKLCYEQYMNRPEPCDVCPMIRALRSGKVETAEITGSDGKLYEIISAPLPSPDGTFDKAVEVIMDITERKRAEEALRESEEKLRRMFESTAEGIAVTDLNGVITEVNERVLEMHGFGSKEEVLGKSALELIAPRDHERAMENMRKTLEQGSVRDIEYNLLRADGSEFPGELSASVLTDASANPVGFIAVTSDITARKWAEEEITRYTRRVEALYAIAQTLSRSLDLDQMLDGALETVLRVMGSEIGAVILVDVAKRAVAIKAHRGLPPETIAAVEMMELTPEEVERAATWKESTVQLDKLFGESNLASLLMVMGQLGVRSYIAVPLRGRGGLHGLIAIASRTQRQFSSEDMDLIYAIGNQIEVGIENARLFAEVNRMATTDGLTGLYNHRYFQERLGEEVARALRFGGECSLIMLDLDHFKIYNDLFGHVAGDEALRRVGQILRDHTRQVDIACRYGGEEFAIILPQTAAVAAYEGAERLRRAVETAMMQVSAGGTALTVSLGVASCPSDAISRGELIRWADEALREAKSRGRNQTCLASQLPALARGEGKVDWEVAEHLETGSPNTVYALAAAVDARDHYTYGHSRNVCKYAVAIGRALDLPSSELERLRIAALLHDIGKIGLSDSVLRKPGPLDNEEWEMMKKHSELGATIVSHAPELADCAPAIRHHHEWMDGSGYPSGLKGGSIPLQARIIAIADAYDTMTTPRSYRTTLSAEEALEELRRYANTQFDPHLVETFARLVNEGLAGI